MNIFQLVNFYLLPSKNKISLLPLDWELFKTLVGDKGEPCLGW